MSTKALSFTLVCEPCVIGTLTHPGAHVCALLETQSQPLAGSHQQSSCKKQADITLAAEGLR
eukprot:4804196-Ditylum_brightwellii.AAC.1